MSKQSPRPLVERADAGFGRYVRPGIASVGPVDMTSGRATALANSTNIPSPVVLTIRPRWEATVGSTRVFLTAFSRASVPSSSMPMRVAITGDVCR